MPGLYKSSNKRKRITLNSSCATDHTVWHSTPLDSGLLSEDPPSGNTNVETGRDEEEGEEETLISPVKRPRGLSPMVRPTPVAGDSASLSPTPGPSSASVIDTPAAPLDIVIEDDEFEDRRELFSRDVEEEEEEPELPRRPQRPVLSPRRERGEGVHLSQRFGPVRIHPPSGHGYFSTVLHDNGFVVTLPKNILYNDAAVFRTKMQKWMLEHTQEDSRIEDDATKFMKAMKKYFSVKSNLIHSCTTTLNDTECIQPSLLTCLLGVPLLQKSLFEAVLPAVSESSFSNMQEDVDFVNTVLTQMKWLPVIVDGKKFVEDILNILDAAALPCKRHIIRVLPEIFLPETHSHLVPKLMEIFDLGTAMNVAMLDCFSSLVVPDEDCMRIRRSAVDKMATALLEELPAYIAFLFRVGTPMLHLEEAIREMREKVEIKPRHVKHRTGKEDALMVEILERIRFYVSVNQAVSRIWLAQVKDDLAMDVDLHVLDLLMLLVFAEASNKHALSTLNVIFSRSQMASMLFDHMMTNNNQMMHELFPTIARFLDTVLRIKASKCHDTAIAVTKKLFVGLGPILSQHLTTNLIGVLINGHDSCRDIVLKIFTSIAETDAPKLLYFHAYLMGALVYVIKYPPRQMQALMNILATLAYMPQTYQGEENAFTAEFMILLRKQITHGNLRTRCFGVLGAVAAVKQLALQPSEGTEEKIDSLLALVWSSIENDEEACSIFFDEMISLITLLPKAVCSQFRKILHMQFERLWTATDNQSLDRYNGQAELELAPAFDGNKEMTTDQVVLILEPHTLKTSPLVIPSLLRVMAELEKASSNEGQLDAIDALLGCPILLPKLSTYYEMESLESFGYDQRLHLGEYLVIAINYLRECVSSFVESCNNELRVKVWMRLENIVTLQKYLVKHFESFPSLPLAYGTEKTMQEDPSGPGFSGALLPTRGGVPKKGKKPTKVKPKTNSKQKQASKRKKGKKRDVSAEEVSDTELQEDDRESMLDNDPSIQNMPSACEKKNLEDMIQPRSIFPHVRRLGGRVFEILLEFPLMVESQLVNYTDILLNLSTATQSRKIMRMIQKFNMETLCLLLSEVKRQALDTKCRLSVTIISNLLLYLCNHIDSILNYCREKSDETENTAVTSDNISSCFRLLLDVVEVYLDELSKMEQTSQVEFNAILIQTLASRLRNDSVEELENGTGHRQQDLMNAAKYLEGFVAAIGPLDFEIALRHIKVVKAIHDLLDHSEHIKKAIDAICKHYLTRDWKLPTHYISQILKLWLGITSSPLTIMNHIIEEVFASATEIPNASLYQCCNKINMHTWYSAIMEGLAKHMFKFGRRKGNIGEGPEMWKTANLLVTILVDVSSTTKKSLLLFPLLRFGRVYIEAFNSGGVYLIPHLYKQDVTLGRELVRSLQFTRKIQHICEHSKIVRDSTLLRLVPPIKKSLETLVFKVREAIGALGAADAMYLGNLKHRNLDGQQIGSQAFQKEENSASESEQEVGSEGEDHDVEVVGEEEEEQESEEEQEHEDEIQIEEEDEDDEDM